MPTRESTVFEVSLAAPLRDVRVVSERLHDPGEGALLLAVERFALSGNNISYAQLGNQFGLGYWRPFPATAGWGRVPARGVARVLAGDSALAEVGDRFVGFVPMADHMFFHAKRTATGLRDTSSERKGMLPLYQDMRSLSTDPTWREDLLDTNLVLRPAYPPAALLDDQLRRTGVGAVVVTSATSKTALSTARLLTERGVRTTGLTSGRHVDAAVSTGAYTTVSTYDAVETLPVEPTVLLDVAGDPETARAVRARFGDDLLRDVFIGGTHHEVASADPPAASTPEREMFNTGGREAELADSWGEQEVLRLETVARDRLVPWAATWLLPRAVHGVHEIAAEWHRLVRGPQEDSPLTGTVVTT